ncbi:hypothetical protein JOM56_005907 [Amanita muscaria]
MNSFASSSHHPLTQNSSSPPYLASPMDPEFRRLFASATYVLDQAPPPSLREILAAYSARGDGDREMLLSMLNAKAAEDQRIASIATLHRTTLELYQVVNADSRQSPLYSINGPSCAPPHNPSVRQYEHKNSQRSRSRHRSSSRSCSPSRSRIYIPPIRDAPKSDIGAEHPRKRPRVSQSSSSRGKMNDPFTGPHPDHLPPSPYSSSSRSDSAECSPRSRASMAIGSLLSSGPKPSLPSSDIRQD